jgi:hypothetical protein
MLTPIRQAIIRQLWNRYTETTPQIRHIVNGLSLTQAPPIDHFACIDLPSLVTGIPVMETVFNLIGYEKRGQGYLASKQNDFTWLAEQQGDDLPASSVLPQVVVADFRLEEMPATIRAIIEKYAKQAKPAPITTIKHWLQCAAHGDVQAINKLETIYVDYFSGRDWPLPTINEFKAVHAFNELLAWVLVFGRRPNHFTLSVHLLGTFNNLTQFNSFIENTLNLPLNIEGGVIKGKEALGIAQSSTVGTQETIQLADGAVHLPVGFVEFVWRYPLAEKKEAAYLWRDYFTGFVADHADYVIESLYTT